MNRRSRSRDNMTSLRPRPVTATVTKPSWMQPEAIVGPRSRSVESRGSTASLTSVLDHDSCESLTDDEFEEEFQQAPRRDQENIPSKLKQHKDIQNNAYNRMEKKVIKKKVLRKFVESSQTDETETDGEPDMSPWEQWLIQKVKDDREKRKEERRKKQEEKRKKEEEEMEKRKKLEKAEQVRSEWVDRKNFEEKLKIKVEKQRTKTEKMIKDEQKKMTDVKAERKFQDWREQKKEEEREKKRAEKQKQMEEERLRKEQKIKAQVKYEAWCKKADQRPRSMPNSFGYTGGKLTGDKDGKNKHNSGYHDTSAYPVPAFYNPMPWQPIHIPRQASEKPKKTKRSKPKPKYVWNPEKYR